MGKPKHAPAEPLDQGDGHHRLSAPGRGHQYWIAVQRGDGIADGRLLVGAQIKHDSLSSFLHH